MILQSNIITLNFYIVTFNILCSAFYLFKYVHFMLECLTLPTRYLYPEGQTLFSLHKCLHGGHRSSGSSAITCCLQPSLVELYFEKLNFKNRCINFHFYTGKQRIYPFQVPISEREVSV